MSPAETFLARVEWYKQTGAGRWIFKVPGRKDKRPSGSARELEDGRLLIHDFAGSSAAEMLAAVGLEMTDLYPEKLSDHGKPERRTFWAADALKCCAFEAMVCAAAAVSMAAGEPLSSVDRDRLMVAAERLNAAAKKAGL